MEDNFQTTASLFSLTNRQSQLRVRNMVLIGLLFLFTLMTAADSASGAASSIVPPQEELITGQWTAEFPKDQADKVYLILYRQTEKGDSKKSGSGVLLTELQGLRSEQATIAKANVKFRLTREAGTFEFEGAFSGGKGAGHWTLTPSQQFITAMRERGFDNLTGEQLVSSVMFDVHPKTIDDLEAAGRKLLSMNDVFKVTIFKITPEYIRELQSLGYDNLDIEDLVKGRIFKITPDFVREVKAMGFSKEPLESLIKLRIFKITTEFAREMRAAGLSDVSLKDLVKLKIHKVDTGFIERVRASGHVKFDAQELIRLRVRGVVK